LADLRGQFRRSYFPQMKAAFRAERKDSQARKRLPLMSEREEKKKETRVYRESYEYQQATEDRTKIAWQIYLGKLAIAQSWMIANPKRLNPGRNYVENLDRKVRRHKSYLQHRGEI